MAELEGSGGGTVGKLWRKHGGGYYALLAVGTFAYLEVSSVRESLGVSESFADFIRSELVTAIITLGLETFVNTLMAGIWPFIWMTSMGWKAALAWAGGGYLVWGIVLSWLLSRREKQYRRELGL